MWFSSNYLDLTHIELQKYDYHILERLYLTWSSDVWAHKLWYLKYSLYLLSRLLRDKRNIDVAFLLVTRIKFSCIVNFLFQCNSSRCLLCASIEQIKKIYHIIVLWSKRSGNKVNYFIFFIYTNIDIWYVAKSSLVFYISYQYMACDFCWFLWCCYFDNIMFWK